MAHATLEVLFRRIRHVLIRSVDLLEKPLVLMALNEFFHSQYKEAAARNLHFASHGFSLVKQALLY